MFFSVKRTETVVHDVQLGKIVVLCSIPLQWDELPATTGGEQIWFSKVGVISDSIKIVDQ
jgi:hypothetical protein